MSQKLPKDQFAHPFVYIYTVVRSFSSSSRWHCNVFGLFCHAENIQVARTTFKLSFLRHWTGWRGTCILVGKFKSRNIYIIISIIDMTYFFFCNIQKCFVNLAFFVGWKQKPDKQLLSYPRKKISNVSLILYTAKAAHSRTVLEFCQMKFHFRKMKKKHILIHIKFVFLASFFVDQKYKFGLLLDFFKIFLYYSLS